MRAAVSLMRALWTSPPTWMWLLSCPWASLHTGITVRCVHAAQQGKILATASTHPPVKGYGHTQQHYIAGRACYCHCCLGVSLSNVDTRIAGTCALTAIYLSVCSDHAYFFASVTCKSQNLHLLVCTGSMRCHYHKRLTPLCLLIAGEA